jgi:hypothetical protein
MKHRLLILMYFSLGASCFLRAQSKSTIDTVDQYIKIQFNYGFNHELNTFEGYFRKDLAVKEYVTIPFSFTKKELDNIKSVILDSINFFSLPDTLHRASWLGPMSPDPGLQILRIKYGAREHKVLWDCRMSQYVETQRIFLKLVRMLIDIIDSRPEVKLMPKEKFLRL